MENSGFSVNWMNLRDGDSGSILWQSKEDFSKSSTEHKASVPKSILKCNCVSREINFSSKESMEKLNVVQKIYFRGKVMEEWYFNFGFVIPESTNSWQSVIEAASANEMIPAKLLSGNVVIKTDFYNDTTLITSSNVRIFYV